MWSGTRRIGRWLTPVKPLIPLLQSADSSSANTCNFTMKTVPWAMAWVPTLNIRLVGKIQVLDRYETFHSREKALVPVEVIPLFRGGTFDKNYNAKYRPITFVPPQGTDKVKLVATITGHGSDNNNCAEFCVTSHHFVVNNKHNYTRVFKNAGTALGCADRVLEGVVPNEHGTWLYGRDGWCDGQEVVPWVVDITSALKLLTIRSSTLVGLTILIPIQHVTLAILSCTLIWCTTGIWPRSQTSLGQLHV